MDRLSSPLLALFASLNSRPAPSVARPGWQRHFDARATRGTFVLFEPARDRYLVLDEARARRRFLPGATFEIAAALIGLETGAIADEQQVFAWDGKPKPRAAWERDQSLHAAMRAGTAWVFQDVTRRTGKDDMGEWLERLEYGNASLSGGLDHFWLQGGLRINAYEQVRLLHRLAEGRLPATQRAQRLVRQCLVVEAARGYTLFAKAAHAAPVRDALAWWVGWIEKKGKPAAYFAMNCAATRAMGAEGPVALGRAILREAGALPSECPRA